MPKKEYKPAVSVYSLQIGDYVIKYNAMCNDTKYTVNRELLDMWKDDTWFEDATFRILKRVEVHEKS